MPRARIMLVEDEAITALDIRTSLEELDYEVPVVTASGAEALKLAAETSPDLILMDITLNNCLNGIEVAKQIRQTQQIPIIFLTAHQDNETVAQAITAEPFGYLIKPSSLDSMKTSIEVALYKHAADQRVREAEEHLRQGLEQLVSERTHDLERINLELAEFCYAISHELRAPIARMQGMSEVLLEECRDCQNVTARRYAERIHCASHQQQKVVDAILQLSRLSSTTVKRQPINLSSLVTTIMDKVRTEGPDRDITLVIEPNISVSADLALMSACLEHLLHNAFKFTAHTRNAQIEFGQQRQNDETVYFVRDNGVGFDMEYRNKLFVPFQHLHHQEDYPGIGIGLAIIARIVKRHSGKIWAEAAPEKGATFFFTLDSDREDSHAA